MHCRDHSGEKISALGPGGCSLGGAYGKKDPGQFAATVHRAYDLGVTFFDVADIYGPAEELLGRAFVTGRMQLHSSECAPFNRL